MGKTFTKRLGILRRKDGMTHQAFVSHCLASWPLKPAFPPAR